MRFVITGGTGFIGAYVLRQLRGHDVLCFSRHPDAIAPAEGLAVKQADFGKGGEWAESIKDFQPECCIHLAWEGLPDYSLPRCRINLDASLRLLEVLSQARVKRLVVSGSCFEYGDVNGPVCEDQESNSRTVFAATKVALLKVLDAVATDFDYRWARLFFVYGPGQRLSSLIPSLRNSYAKNKTPEIRTPEIVQDFVHVEDVADALVTLGEYDGPSGIFNVGSGYPTSVGYVANQVAQYYGRDALFGAIVKGKGFWADSQNMTSCTGWSARIGIDDGIRKTLVALDTKP